MNPIDVFLSTTTLKPDIKPVIEDGQLYLIEYDKTHTFPSKVHISSHRLYGTQYQRIKKCCDKRSDNPKMVFICDRDCQICIPYLLSKVYNYLYYPQSTPEIVPTSPKSKMLEETLYEIFDEEETTTATAAPMLKSVSNPLDGAVITFGKHKGCTFKDVFESDKGYCMWCIENSSVKQFVEPHKKPLQNMVLFVSYVKQKFTAIA
jgi:hypothetical protein